MVPPQARTAAPTVAPTVAPTAPTAPTATAAPTAEVKTSREGRAHRDAVRELVPAGRPLRITIPVLGVDAPVVPIDTSGSVLLPPSDPATIGWWADGARPGAKRGAALLTGHTVHTGGGAFDDLDRIPVRSTVRIATSRGRLAYVVRRVQNYPKQSLAAHAATLFSQERRGRLVLVTCEDWNGEAYLSNAVVVADPAW